MSTCQSDNIACPQYLHIRPLVFVSARLTLKQRAGAEPCSLPIARIASEMPQDAHVAMMGCIDLKQQVLSSMHGSPP